MLIFVLLHKSLSTFAVTFSRELANANSRAKAFLLRLALPDVSKAYLLSEPFFVALFFFITLYFSVRASKKPPVVSNSCSNIVILPCALDAFSGFDKITRTN